MLKLRTVLLAALSLVIVALAVAPAAGAKARVSCAPHGAHVVTSSEQAVVFTRATGGGDTYYGCVRSGKAPVRQFALDPSAMDVWAEDSVSDVRLSGATVSWTISHEPGASCRYGNPCGAPTHTRFTLSLTTGARESVAL